MAGKVVYFAGKVIYLAGKVIYLAGKVIYFAGQVIYIAGRVIYVAGKVIYSAGKVICSVGKVVYLVGKVHPLPPAPTHPRPGQPPFSPQKGVAFGSFSKPLAGMRVEEPEDFGFKELSVHGLGFGVQGLRF